MATKDNAIVIKREPRKLPPAGNFFARCVYMVDLGTHEETGVFNGRTVTSNKRKLRIGWELPTEMNVFKDGDPEKPFMVFKEFTMSLAGQSKLLPFINQWRGTPMTPKESSAFEITKLMNQTGMINIVHKESKANPGTFYEEVTGITQVPLDPTDKSKKKKLFDNIPRFNDFIQFSMGVTVDEAAVENFPGYIKDKIKSSFEFKSYLEEKGPSDIPEDETLKNPVPKGDVALEDLPF
jgi:hypothetical protein